MEINKFRKQNKLTQKRISEIIGCHHKTIAYMNSRMNEHLFIQYLKLLRQHGFDVNEFIDYQITLIEKSPETE